MYSIIAFKVDLSSGFQYTSTGAKIAQKKREHSCGKLKFDYLCWDGIYGEKNQNKQKLILNRNKIWVNARGYTQVNV